MPRARAAALGHRWEGAEQDASADRDVASPDLATGHVHEIRSRYLIACDGAGSPVRKSLGIEQVGPERLQSFVMIHFDANLRALVKDCPGVLYWLTDPDARASCRARHRPRVGLHALLRSGP